MNTYQLLTCAFCQLVYSMAEKSSSLSFSRSVSGMRMCFFTICMNSFSSRAPPVGVPFETPEGTLLLLAAALPISSSSCRACMYVCVSKRRARIVSVTV